MHYCCKSKLPPFEFNTVEELEEALEIPLTPEEEEMLPKDCD